MSDSCHAIRPDAQPFDRVEIVTEPRYKTSGMSGDEWRISACIRFYRKGQMVHEVGGFKNVEFAAGCVYGELQAAIDKGKAYFAGDGVHCDQEGCDSPAELTYKLKKAYCREGHATPPYERHAYRSFCLKHAQRGDCGLDDADRNYERVKP